MNIEAIAKTAKHFGLKISYAMTLLGESHSATKSPETAREVRVHYLAQLL